MTATQLFVPAFSRGIIDEVIEGLRSNPKTLPPKLFYDAVGAGLFERICELPEYYLTRTELSILRSAVDEIAGLIGPGAALIEYGSGAGQKIRLLLDTLENPRVYMPVDISAHQLADVAESLAVEYPRVEIKPVCADYTARFELPALPQGVNRRVAFFPGSTIGNFHPAHAAAFLSRVRTLIGPNGMLLLGVDRVKDPRVLHAAYNDAEGVTARFNLNLLERIVRETGARIDVEAFEHHAFFNADASRIEMHLRSRVDQECVVGDARIVFAAGETIWTESSYKYSEESFEALITAAGFETARLWTDDCDNFWVALLRPRCDSSDPGNTN
jgi:dimethylhistidine N-methyltransferase